MLGEKRMLGERQQMLGNRCWERSKKGTHRGLTSFEEPRPPVVPCLRVRCEGAEVETYTTRYRDTLFLVERRSSALTGVARRASLLVRR